MAEEWVLPRVGSIEDPLRLAVLISGSGSGMEALIRHQQDTDCLHITNVVISDRSSASGLAKAEALGVSAIAVPLPDVEDKHERRLIHESEVLDVLSDFGIELIILSGYMRILTPSFVKPWAGRILNIHPSLLPNFPGAHAHRDVIAAGVKKSGCTVHFVDSGMDTGPIIASEEVVVLPSDNEETLAERVKKKEHLLYPKVIDMISQGIVQSP
ncbi:MAG: phosphoribosylglycinamide formyltransferase [Euryarchaeota archaeon]|nr:phosphoribosylglycinamide formyltransferase [Euryarchaeota archaeon]MBJ64833.1 phosphoribosylglycinamide formyltransferase [Euryarchaeota archaeon]|tara:strand:- start:45 stop:683 length:639 start_codon:yes stop_codon:yes gene_type:complete